MNSRFKFPRRVRIHGGECGAVARALHHEVEGSSLYQADSGKALESTIERKQMSTKTTLKRIALVAVSALGFGLMSSVAPANAAAGTGSTISSVVIGTVPSARAGETVIVPVTVNLAAATASDETVVIAAKVSAAPSTAAGNTATSVMSSASGSAQQVSGSARLWISTSATGAFPAVTYGALTASTLNTSGVTADRAYLGSAGSTAGDLAAGSSSGGVVPAAVMARSNTSADSTIVAYIAFVPDIAGTYSFLVSATSWAPTTDTTPAHATFVAGDSSATFSVTTGGAPTGVTLTNLSGTTTQSGSYGSLLRVNLTGGSLTTDEAINVTVSAGEVSKATVSGAGAFTSVVPTSTTTASLTKSDFVNGVAYVNVQPTASSQSIVVTATGTGALAAISGTATVASMAAAGTSLTATSFKGRGGTAVTTGFSSATAASSSDGAMNIPNTATSTTLELGFADLDDATAYYGYIQVKDTGGRIAGAPTTGNALYFDKGFSCTGSSATSGACDTYTTISLSHTAYATGTGFEFDPYGSSVVNQTLSGAASATSSSTGSVTVQYNGVTTPSIRAAAAGSVVASALVKDQFALAMSGASVTVTVAGRNSARTSETLITSSTGYVTTTITDAGTTSASDVVTFAHSGGASSTLTITWGTYTVGTVTVTGGKTASDTYKGQNTTAISTAVAGPHGASVAITATVKDADGVLLAGVPVTFTVSKGLIQKTATIDYTTVYTGALGTAVTRVIDWTEGEQVITATAGGKSGTDYLTWEAKTAASARSISGVAAGNKVTATVKDRYGNTVSGVTVKAATNAGYFGTGTNSTTGSTDADGNVSFFISGAQGAATVTLSLDKDTYVESLDVAGQVGATAVTAAVAGTTVGTGASLSAAGVNSVTVAVTATDAAADAANAASDAAAEAIDAANAATDAANLAAEAADAATVAAEEARDAADAATAAVEELATQVATLMAALKAQITTLANTVAKIAKKVKA